MRTITLWQPWASLIAAGVKSIETRGWQTPYPGPLAIHAAARPIHSFAAYISPELDRLLVELEWLYPADDGRRTIRQRERIRLPYGAVVATANLVGCVPMTKESIACVPALYGDKELICGDYQPGRVMWVLDDVKPVLPPVPAVGRQGFWNWEGLTC